MSWWDVALGLGLVWLGMVWQQVLQERSDRIFREDVWEAIKADRKAREAEGPPCGPDPVAGPVLPFDPPDIDPQLN